MAVEVKAGFIARLFTLRSATTCHLTNSAPIEAVRTVWRHSGIMVDMREPEHFEILENYAVFSLIGPVSVERAIDLVTTAIVFARARHIRNLLVDASNLTGFEPPSVIKRYFFVHDWARASAGFVRVALVTRPEMLDPQRFGRTVAANIGFIADAFTTEEDALSWLQGVR